jgi:hypothetical protein
MKLALCLGFMQRTIPKQSEAVCLPIIIVCLLENNKTRKWKRKEKMWLKNWLENRSDFSQDNPPRELEMFLPLGCNLFTNLSFCFWWIIGNYYSFYKERIHNCGRLLCSTSNEIIHCDRCLYNLCCTNCFIGCRLCHINTNHMLCVI